MLLTPQPKDKQLLQNFLKPLMPPKGSSEENTLVPTLKMQKPNTQAMKKTVLLTLLWSLISSSLFAASTSNTPPFGESQLHENSEEDFFLPPPCGNGDVYLLDSTYNYLSTGTPGLWILDERDIFSYNTQGWEIQDLNYLRNATNTGWDNNRKYTFIYNTDGELIQRLRQDWNGTTWVNKYLYNNTFNAQGLRILSTRSDWNGSTWLPAVKYTYTYNANNLLILRIRQIRVGTTWVYDQKYTYTYDANGYRIKNEVSDWNPNLNTWELSYKYDYTNDAQGKVLTRIKSLWTNGNWVENSKTDYFYDTNNNRSLWIKYLKTGNAWIEDSKKEYFWSFYNAAPTDISLSDNTFNQGDPSGTVVGTFSTSDSDDSNHTYTLTPGDGTNDQHNNLFSIVGNQLRLNADFTNLPGPFYIFVQTNDGRGGLFCKAFTIYKCNSFSLNTIISKASCYGSCDGYILLLSVANGTAPYSYSWSNGANTPSIFMLCAGSYTISITDLNGCSHTESFSISQPDPLSVNITSTNETCNNCNDGTASASANGGTPPYQYLWSSGDTTANISALPPGTYTLSITDANGCTAQDSVLIQAFGCSDFDITSSLQNASCFNLCNGSIDISQVNAGTPPYQYFWSSGDTTASINNLCSGDYSLTITDASLCADTFSFSISQPDSLSANITSTNETCNNCNDGTASASANGGTPPYQYLWSSGDTTANISALPPGTYTLSITDANGCTLEEDIEIEEFLCFALGLFYTIEDEMCYGACEGVITIDSITGGAAPYTYEWSTGDTTSTISNLCAGAYFVTATDANNCKVAQNFTLGANDELIPNLTFTNASCISCEDGSAQVNPQGGTPPYQLLWSTGDTSTALFNLPQGSYSITITDALGCTTTDTFDIGVTCLPMPIEVHTEEISCYGYCDGQITINLPGNDNAYSFLWTTGDTTSYLENLCPGTYGLTITEEETGCQEQFSFTLSPPPPLQIELITLTNFDGNNMGSIDIEVNGGSLPYSYIWTDSSGQVISSEQDLNNLTPGCYDLLIEDAAACSLDTTFCISDLSVAVAETQRNDPIILYPNPASGNLLFLYLPEGNTSNKPVKVELISPTGKKTTPQLQQFSDKQWQIDLPANLPAGFYFVRIHAKDFSSYTSFMLLQK